MDPANIFVMNIGEVLELDHKSCKRAGTVPSGRVLIDGYGVGDVGNIVLRDRRHLAQDGLIVVVATVDIDEQTIVSGPDIISRGFVYVREAEELMNEAKSIANDVLTKALDSVSHREYGTGFFFNSPHEDANTVASPGYIREKAYLATAVSGCEAGGVASFVQRNKVVAGQAAELLTPGKTGIGFEVAELSDEGGNPIESAPHPGMIFTLRCPTEVRAGDILRGA